MCFFDLFCLFVFFLAQRKSFSPGTSVKEGMRDFVGSPLWPLILSSKDPLACPQHFPKAPLQNIILAD